MFSIYLLGYSPLYSPQMEADWSIPFAFCRHVQPTTLYLSSHLMYYIIFHHLFILNRTFVFCIDMLGTVSDSEVRMVTRFNNCGLTM